MGTDCRAWLEYRDGPKDRWWALMTVHFRRDKVLYRAMRSDGADAIRPRGFPEDASFGVRMEAELRVVAEATNSPYEITPDEAATGLPNKSPEDFPVGANVLDPGDWDHSWFTAQELEQALARADEIDPLVDRSEVRAVLAAMKALPEARLVFCFSF